MRLESNVLAAACEYCGSAVQRVLSSEEQVGLALKQGLSALRTGKYEEAGIYFGEMLRAEPANKEAWLYRAAALAFLPYANLQEAESFLQTSGYGVEEGARLLSEQTSASLELMEACLRKAMELQNAPGQLRQMLRAAGLGSCNPGHRERLARAYVEFAEAAWRQGNSQQAIEDMVQALKLDPQAEGQNKWLVELARKKMGVEK